MLDLLRYCAKISGRVNNSKMERMGHDLIICKAQVHLQAKQLTLFKPLLTVVKEVKEEKKKLVFDANLASLNQNRVESIIQLKPVNKDIVNIDRFIKVIYTYKRTFNHRILLDF